MSVGISPNQVRRLALMPDRRVMVRWKRHIAKLGMFMVVQEFTLKLLGI